MGQSTSPRFGMFSTESRTLRAAGSGQEYDIGIWLPFSYGRTQTTYPVLYVPDGEFLFPLVAGLLPMLIGPAVPEMIVVGIAYHGTTTWEEFAKLRDRDYVPAELQEKRTDAPGTRLPQCVQFVQKQLIPCIERDYRASPQDRTLLGYSGSGYFSLHMMLNHPGTFRRHVAGSCTWGGADELLLAAAKRYAQLPSRDPVDLFLAVGALEEPMIGGFNNLIEVLRRVPEVRLDSLAIEGEGHTSAAVARTFLSGMKAVFRK